MQMCVRVRDEGDNDLSGPGDPESQTNQHTGKLAVADRSRRRGVKGSFNPAIGGYAMLTVTWGP